MPLLHVQHAGLMHRPEECMHDNVADVKVLLGTEAPLMTPNSVDCAFSAGQGRAGQGRAGQGRAGQGRAGQGSSMVTLNSI